MTPKRLAAGLALALASLCARAEDLLAVYHETLSTDPVFQAARAQYRAGVEALPQARAGYLPILSGTASAFHDQISPNTGRSFDYNTTTYAVTLSQPIFRAQNWVQIGQARLQVLQAEAALAGAQQNLILRVAQAYFDVLLARDNVALSGSQKTAISEQLAQAKRNFEVGTATIVDTLEAQARYDQANAKEISDKNDLEVKRRALQVLLGREPGGLTPLKEPLVLAPPQPADIEAWVKEGGASNFSIVAARANQEIAHEEIRKQKAGYLPTLDANASYGRLYNPTQAVEGVIGPIQNSGSFGITLSMPFLNGGLTTSLVRQAVANAEKADQDLESTARNVAQSIRTSFLNVTSGIAQVRALEQAQASTQSQLDSTILGRDVGVRTSVDVLNAQQQVYQTRRDLQQARYNYLINTLQLKSAAGQLAEVDVEAVNRALAH